MLTSFVSDRPINLALYSSQTIKAPSPERNHANICKP